MVSAKDHTTLLEAEDQIELEEKYRRDEESHENLVLQLIVFASEFPFFIIIIKNNLRKENTYSTYS